MSSGLSEASLPLLLTLRNEETLECYDVLRKRVNLIGRAGFNADLEIRDDPSVSRSHAEISLVKKTDGRRTTLVLKLVDNTSKFGTFVNDGIETKEKIPSNRPVYLELDDRICFGGLNSIWTVVAYSIVACPSTLKMADKEMLKKTLTKLKGKVIRNWSEECTHLCMNAITVTEKVLISLASAKSIILPKYFIDLCEALSPGSSKELPFCIDYQPNLIENILNSNLVSLTVNNKRRTLFFGKTFICSTIEQLNRISTIIKAAGGKTIYYFDISSNSDILNYEEYIFMQQDQSSTDHKKKEVYQLIIRKCEALNKRSIPESDIGLAIIYISTVKHCNPNYNASLVNLQSQQSNLTEPQLSSKVLAPETEMITVVEESEVFSINVVPDSHPETQIVRKRSLEIVMDSEEIESTTKKQKLLSNNSKNYDISISKEESKPFKVANKLTSSNVNHSFKLPESIEPVINNVSSKMVDSCVTELPSSQNDSSKTVHSPWLHPNVNNDNVSNISSNSLIEAVENRTVSKRNFTCIQNSSNDYSTLPQSNATKNTAIQKTSNSRTETIENVDVSEGSISSVQSSQNDYSAWLQSNVTKNSVNNASSFISKTVENEAVAKRKISNINAMVIDEDEDPFDYLDVDEIEEQPKKKLKLVNMKSLLFPTMATSNDKTKQQEREAQDELKANKTVDPNFVMNLLSEAKGTGEFIDASKPLNKSIEMIEDSGNDDLVNSVIIETVKMVVSRPSQSTTQSFVQECSSTFQNFKRFKRKEPMRIPHIVTMELV